MDQIAFLRGGKWDGIWDRDKYRRFREAIITAYGDIVFDEGPHKYYLNGKEMTCVSNVTHLFKEEFDSVQKANETFMRNYDNESSKYYHMTADEILAQWKSISNNATTIGSERHEFGESCFYFMTGRPDMVLDGFKDRITLDNDGNTVFEAVHPKEMAIAQFWNDIPQCMVPILAENKVYDERLSYSGTFDILFYYDAELDGKPADCSGFVIFDYKTNRDLYKNFRGKRLLDPFTDLLDMSVNIYTLQLSLYQNCIENIGMKVIGRRLIWIKEDGSYEKVPLAEYVDKLRNWLTEHPIHG